MVSDELALRDRAEVGMVAAQLSEQPTVVAPVTGEVLDLRDPVQVAEGIERIREAKHLLDELRRLLVGVIRLESQKLGTKTLQLGDGLTATVTGGERVDYDTDLLAQRLGEAGMPEDRIDSLIVETVSYRVDWRVARQVAAANPAYKAALDECRRTVPAPWNVTIERR